MKKLLFLIILLTSGTVQAQDVTVYVENSMMSNSAPEIGAVDLGTFDPFNPSFNCSSFIAPNTCTPQGRGPVEINLSFSYLVEIQSGATSVDLDFSSNNGLGGSTGSFTDLNMPTPIFNITDQGSGTFDVSFSMPLFGPASHLDYGMDIIIDVTINP